MGEAGMRTRVRALSGNSDTRPLKVTTAAVANPCLAEPLSRYPTMKQRGGHRANPVQSSWATVTAMNEDPISERAKRPSRRQMESMRRRVSERVDPDGRYQPLWPDEVDEDPSS